MDETLPLAHPACATVLAFLRAMQARDLARPRPTVMPHLGVGHPRL